MANPIPTCPEGCRGTDGPPYCHCQSCGETGVLLNGEGYCGDCTALASASNTTADQPLRPFANWAELLNWLRYAE